MFSGLTNQVSSWMGSAKGDQEEKVPTPTEETPIQNPEKKDIRYILYNYLTKLVHLYAYSLSKEVT